MNIKKKLSIYKTVEKLDKEVQKKKMKKYIRDTNDYKSNKVYRWQELTDEQPSASRDPTEEMDVGSVYPHIPVKYEGHRRDSVRGGYGRGRGTPQASTPQYGVPTQNRFEPLRHD